MTINDNRRALVLACTALALAACDESSPTLNADNAVSAAACALEPLAFLELPALAATVRAQTAASCSNGGVLLRSEDADALRIQADHCVLADGTTLGGTFTETYPAAATTAVDWRFEQISSTRDGDGTRLDGSVQMRQTSRRTTLRFDSLAIDDVDDGRTRESLYGASELHVDEGGDPPAATIDYRTRIDLCGRGGLALDTATPTPLTQHDTDFFPRAGEVEARAGDGSRLRILIDGDQLTLRVDSNADQVDDTQLAMSWAAFNLATARSRARAAGAPPTLWPLPRLRPGPTWESPATSPTPP